MKEWKNFVVFEGCEGVGKTHHLKLIKEYLDKTNQEAIFTREPGGPVVAEKIREIILTQDMHPLTEAYLFAAQRIEHIDKVIKPALQEGKLVICDRYVDSSIAYQGYARELGRKKVEEINHYALEHCMPQTVIFIDLHPSNSWRKRNGNIIEDDRMENESSAFHSKVYEGFKDLAKTTSRFIEIVPCEDKNQTQEKIKKALQDKGIIL